jgi:WD40 repeat protein
VKKGNAITSTNKKTSQWRGCGALQAHNAIDLATPPARCGWILSIYSGSVGCHRQFRRARFSAEAPTSWHFSCNYDPFSPDGTRIVSGSGDKTLRVWDSA